MKIHPAAAIFPMLSDAELDELAADIREHGQRHPVIVLKGAVLDGRNRYEACSRVGVAPKVVEFDGACDPIDFVISANLKRRHLDPAQKAAVAAELEPIFAERARRKQIEAGKLAGRGHKKNLRDDSSQRFTAGSDSRRSTAQAAKTVGAGIGATKAMKSVREKAPEVLELAKQGLVNVSQAKKLATLSEGKRKKAAERIAAGEPPSKVLPKPQPVTAEAPTSKAKPTAELVENDPSADLSATADSAAHSEDDWSVWEARGRLDDAIEREATRCPDREVISLLTIIAKWHRKLEERHNAHVSSLQHSA